MIIWTGTIGHTDLERSDDTLPSGSGQPMSEAIEAAFESVTGVYPNITFSGFGQKYLDESHLAVVEGRSILDDPTHALAWNMARAIVEDLVLEEQFEYDMDEGRAVAAVSALTELIWFRNKKMAPVT